jgi:threonine/homoserine/homoserine lactone efflux protein
VTDPVAFALAYRAQLATPGPADTLLVTSGAAVASRRSVALMRAERAGSASSIAALALVIGPLLQELPAVAVGLKLAC